MEVVLVRHAETVWNAEARWQGQTDVPLSDAGRDQVRAVAARLRGQRFDRIVSSDLARALDTARGIADACVDAPEIETSTRFREMNLGQWCGLLHTEVEARFPAELRALSAASGDEGAHRRIGVDGETLLELSARVGEALDELISSAGEHQRVLVVTHGGVIRAVLMQLLALSGVARPLVGSGNTAITQLTVARGVRRLASYNDGRHLEPLPPDGLERVVGPGGRARVLEVLGLAEDTKLALPGEHDETHVSPTRRQLVAFGLPPLSPR